MKTQCVLSLQSREFISKIFCHINCLCSSSEVRLSSQTNQMLDSCGEVNPTWGSTSQRQRCNLKMRDNVWCWWCHRPDTDAYGGHQKEQLQLTHNCVHEFCLSIANNGVWLPIIRSEERDSQVQVNQIYCLQIQLWKSQALQCAL